jgi:hypothetical protein
MAVSVLPSAAATSASGSAQSKMRAAAANARVRAAEGPSGPGVVVADGLDNPKKLTTGPGGAVFVAEAGKGGDGPCADDPEGGKSCYGPTGAVTRIASGTQSRVVTGLPSAASQDNGPDGPPPGSFAAGPADVVTVDGQLRIITQTQIDQNGDNAFGQPGQLFGHIIAAPANSANGEGWAVGADFGKYEAQNNPDKGAGAEETGQSPIDSDPYALIPTTTGYAVADAAGNDLLATDANGNNISLLGVFPTKEATAPPDQGGGQFNSQAVPTSVALGPDGAFYVGELALSAGSGNARVWRLMPGQAPVVFASGFSNIQEIGFDPQGRLMVLELTKDFNDENAPGALIRMEPDGSRTELLSDGLVYPGGFTFGSDGSLYVSNFSIFPGTGNGPHGQVLKFPMAPVPGYRMYASDGGAFTFGVSGFFGSQGGSPLNKPIVAADPTGPGYRMASSDGGVFTFGTSRFFGSMGGQPLNKPIVAMASTFDDLGYWLVASDGGVFTFGDAAFAGSLGAKPLNKPIVGMAAAPGGGYWMVASDGGIFTFGRAGFFGSHGGSPLNKPIVAMAATPSGEGYWLVASDGGIFTYGDAAFFGSTGNMVLNKPIVGIVPATDGSGYRLIASDGGVFVFGKATFNGSLGGAPLNQPIVAAST